MTRLLELMRLLADYDDHGALSWSTDNNDELKFWNNCNDIFYWGCADAEDITDDDVDQMRKSYEDIERLSEKDGRLWASMYGSLLYCCRKRAMRPQGCCYPKEREIWPLIDACGPEREVGLGNPYPPGKPDR